MASLTYLQLCNQLIQKCGIAGGSIMTVANQIGEPRRVVNWINEAYVNIQQLHHNWLWMEKDVQFTTTPGQASYTTAQCNVTDFGEWLEESFRIYITSVGVGSETFLFRMDYQDYRDYYLFNNTSNTPGYPISISVGPDKSLNLGLAPDNQGYTVVGKYFSQPSDLVLDTDVPALPPRFHMFIVYEAMKSYANYEAAAETLSEAMRQYGRMYKNLVISELPRASVGGFR